MVTPWGPPMGSRGPSTFKPHDDLSWPLHMRQLREYDLSAGRVLQPEHLAQVPVNIRHLLINLTGEMAQAGRADDLKITVADVMLA